MKTTTIANVNEVISLLLFLDITFIICKVSNYIDNIKRTPDFVTSILKKERFLTLPSY